MEHINLPGYRILEKIGQGRTGTVWAARQLSPERTVALKIFHPQLFNDREFLVHLVADIQAASQIEHPGMVRIYDAGVYEDFVFCTSEFVIGCPVRELLDRKGYLSEKNALATAQGVCLVLDYVWTRHQVFHHHLCPENISINPEGTIRITDLGTARLIRQIAMNAAPDKVVERFPYAAPELVRGETYADFRSDVYSLGATLYHMATGHPPREKRDTRSGEKQATGFLPDPRELNPDLSSGLAWLVEKMMIKDSMIRYHSWAEVTADVESVLAGGQPLGKLPAPGDSTILRNEEKAKAAAKATRKNLTHKLKHLTQKIATIKEGKKKKIVLPAEMRQSLVSSASRRGPDLSSLYFSLALLGAVGILVFFGLKYMHFQEKEKTKQDSQYWERQLPPRSAYQSEPKPSIGTRKTTTRESATVSPSREAPATRKNSGPVEWKDPSFLEGAQLFNEALTLYKTFMKDKKDPAVLKTVEEKSRRAANLLESCRDRAPDDVNVAEYIDQAYRLIADTRWSTLVDDKEEAPKKRGKADVEMPEPAAPASVQDMGPKSIELAKDWNAPVEASGEPIKKDLQALLSDWGGPGVDLVADPSLYLFDRIYYSMKAADAGRVMRLKLSPRRPVSCPGFPKGSFFYYTLQGNFGDNFSKLQLVTDAKDQVVALQLLDDRPPKGRWLEPQFFQDTWLTHNFIESKTKPNIQWKIAHKVTMLDNMLKIDSELAADSPTEANKLGDARERITLLLPQPIVNLILSRIEGSKAAEEVIEAPKESAPLFSY